MQSPYDHPSVKKKERNQGIVKMIAGQLRRAARSFICKTDDEIYPSRLACRYRDGAADSLPGAPLVPLSGQASPAAAGDSSRRSMVPVHVAGLGDTGPARCPDSEPPGCQPAAPVVQLAGAHSGPGQRLATRASSLTDLPGRFPAARRRAHTRTPSRTPAARADAAGS